MGICKYTGFVKTSNGKEAIKKYKLKMWVFLKTYDRESPNPGTQNIA